jgi:hypothetical protein
LQKSVRKMSMACGMSFFEHSLWHNILSVLGMCRRFILPAHMFSISADLVGFVSTMPLKARCSRSVLLHHLIRIHAGTGVDRRLRWWRNICVRLPRRRRPVEMSWLLAGALST